MKRLTILLLLVVPTFFVILSCTPSVSRTSMIEENHIDDRVELDYPALPEEIVPGGYVVEDPQQVILIADTVASNAEIAALRGNFDQAHTLFGIALELVRVLHQQDDLNSDVNTEMIFSRIAEFYVDLLPPAYLDSVPDGLSSYVSKYQLNDLLNTMNSGDVDSSMLMSFQCGESMNYNIPITYNERVQKAMTALLRSGRKNWMETLLARAHYYRPMMNERFDSAGIPTDLTFLPILESAFNPKAYSPAHASGLWQFIPSTGRIFGLRANYWVDERRDPIKSTDAAIGYFTRLYGMFDDWYLSLASYNCGEGRVKRRLRDSGETEYWGINLPKETMNYVPLFIAYQIIAKNPHCFGYSVDTTVSTYDLEVVKVSDCIDLHKIADGIGISYDSLKSINPHIIQWCTPPNMDSVSLYIPSGTTEKYNSFYASLSERDKVDWYRYKIQSGDVLGQIASKFDVSLSALKQINNMKNNRIVAGRYIFVPIPADSNVEEVLARNGSSSTSGLEKKIHTVRRNETLLKIAPKYGVTVNQICEWNGITDPALISLGQKLNIFVKGAPVVPNVPIPSGEKRYYTVQSGESLFSISLKLGVTVEQLAGWNGKSTSRPLIHPGEKLVFYGAVTENRESQKEQAKAVEESGEKQFYTVQSGQSLYSISQRLGVSVNELVLWNDKDVSNPLIHPGEKLVYYTAGTSPQIATKKSSPFVEDDTPTESATTTASMLTYRVKRGDTMYGIAQTFGISSEELLKANGGSSSIHPGDLIKVPVKASEQPVTSSVETVAYRVNSGDNLWSIASNFNVSVHEICEASNITKNTPLHPGDILRIPVKE